MLFIGSISGPQDLSALGWTAPNTNVVLWVSSESGLGQGFYGRRTCQRRQTSLAPDLNKRGYMSGSISELLLRSMFLAEGAPGLPITDRPIPIPGIQPPPGPFIPFLARNLAFNLSQEPRLHSRPLAWCTVGETRGPDGPCTALAGLVRFLEPSPCLTPLHAQTSACGCASRSEWTMRDPY